MMMGWLRGTGLVLALLMALGCEDEESYAGHGGGLDNAEEGAGAPQTHAPPDYLDPPINIPTPYRPPRQSTDTEAEGGSGRGGRHTQQGERFGEAFEELSPAQVQTLFADAQAAAQEADPNDSCGRLFAGFSQFTERGDEGAMMNEGRFMRYCERMSPEMKACFKAPEEQTDAQKSRCQQLLGTNDVFGAEPWGQPDPPADRRPSAEQLRRAQQLQRRARNAGSMQP